MFTEEENYFKNIICITSKELMVFVKFHRNQLRGNGNLMKYIKLRSWVYKEFKELRNC